MFKINEDKTIHLTRGDAATITLSVMNGNEPYAFKQGDVVRFKVCERKACHSIALQKDFPTTVGSTEVIIQLTSKETKIGEIISKPVDYWYEVELNPEAQTQTIIGYDEDGGKILRLYPEGGDN